MTPDATRSRFCALADPLVGDLALAYEALQLGADDADPDRRLHG